MSVPDKIKEVMEKVGALAMILRRLTQIGKELKRIADLYQMDLALRGVFVEPPKADTSGDKPEVLYTDPERDWAREVASRLKEEAAEEE